MAAALSSAASDSDRAPSFTVGDSLVDPNRNAVSTPRGEVLLEPRIMDVLCFLAKHPGEVLTRAQIIDAVWARSFGADESLTRAVSHLRKVLTDAQSPAGVIETIPKRGYRLIAPVTFLPDGSDAVVSVPRGSKTRGPRRLLSRPGLATAVFGLLLAIVAWSLSGSRNGEPAGAIRPITLDLPPFESLDAGLEREARIVGDEVASSLSQSALLGVRRRTTSASPTRSNNVYSLHGTLQRIAPDQIRISVSLTDAATGTGLWSGTFDRLTKASTGVETNELAGSISAEVYNRVLSAAKVMIRKKPANELVPWELTLLATWIPGSDEVFLKPHGPDAFWPQQRALELDPDYAPAHASLASAMAYHALFDLSADSAVLRRGARDHAEHARALAPYDAGVLYELATYYRLIGDRANALAALDRVLALQPSHPVGRYDRIFFASQCRADGRGAIRSLEQTLARMPDDNPVRWVILSHIADLYLADGAAGAAMQAASSSRQIVRMTWSGMTLAASAATLGNKALARGASDETRREWPALEWGRFAKAGVPIWCLNGARQDHAVAAFTALGAVASIARKGTP